jgi:hypothetical protein
VLYLHALTPILPIPARRDPLARNEGWKGIAVRMNEAKEAINSSYDPGSDPSYRHRDGGAIRFGAARYQDVSELAYHRVRDLFDDPAFRVFCTCLSGRHNQYELWPGFPQVAKPGDALILLLDESEGVPATTAALAPYFTTVTRGAPAPLLRGADTVGTRRIWILEGYRGGWPPRSEP